MGSWKEEGSLAGINKLASFLSFLLFSIHPPDLEPDSPAARTTNSNRRKRKRERKERERDFPVSKNVRNKCLCFKPPSLWYFVTAALAD